MDIFIFSDGHIWEMHLSLDLWLNLKLYLDTDMLRDEQKKEKLNYHLLFLFSFLAIRMGHIWIIIPSNIKERNVFSLSNIERPKLFIENRGHPRHPLCPTKFILQYLRFTRKEYPIFKVFYGHNAFYCSIFSHALFSFPRPLQFS